jgi:hypothetical protein
VAQRRRRGGGRRLLERRQLGGGLLEARAQPRDGAAQLRGRRLGAQPRHALKVRLAQRGGQAVGRPRRGHLGSVPGRGCCCCCCC